MFKNDVSTEAQTRGRLFGRLLVDNYLRQSDILLGLHQGDVLKSFIFAAILSANVKHITDDPVAALNYAALDQRLPFKQRKPVSINAISTSLGIPYETTRRYVLKLIEEGNCVRVSSRGVVIPNEAIDRLFKLDDYKQAATNLRRLISALRKAGYDMSGDA
jgi:predicted transcriptional regulator